jgi:hypothetical protein
MNSQRWFFGALVVLAAPAWAQIDEVDSSGTAAHCKIGENEVKVELRGSSDGVGNTTVFLVRPGKQDLEVKFEDDGKRRLFAPPAKAKSACDKTLGLLFGNTLLVVLAEDALPQNPFLVAFTYSASGDEVTWRRREPEKDRISPDASRRLAGTKDGFCMPTRLVSEADTGVCVDSCGSTHGAMINSVRSTLAFDVIRCFKLKGDSVSVTVDTDATWKAAWPELKSAFGSKDAFERGFGFNGNDYEMYRALTAKLSNGKVCAYPSNEARPPSDPDVWICPEKKGK